MARKRTARRRPARKARRGAVRVWGLRLILALIALGLAYLLYLDVQVRSQFEGKRWSLPARVFARPLELYTGADITRAAVLEELSLLRYREVATPREPGEFAQTAQGLRLVTRGFRFAEEVEPSRALSLRIEDGRLAALRQSDVEGEADPGLARVEPLLIANIYPRHNEDRVLVRLQDVPELLTAGLIAIEDRRYAQHNGLDFVAIGRAALANLRAGRTVQGGSTLTQQLVKNFFLSNERTLWRKLNEAAMALLLEWHYDKDEILEAYLNEIYLAQDGARAVHGFGLASPFYFERPLQDLEVDQLALLVALVKGPGYYDPRQHPERARARRDLVVETWAQAGLIDTAEAQAAKARPLSVAAARPSGVTPFPAYINLVREQLRDQYREEDLRSEGLFIFTALDPGAQLAAERAVTRVAARLERAALSEREGLQAAAVVAEAETGEVVAVVGGRDPRFAGFNRALQMRRPIGSLVKPAILVAALSQPEHYTLATRLDDAPLVVPQPGGEDWAPSNYDDEFHGEVVLLDAFVQSYNVAMARLGLDVGVGEVIDALLALGLERRPPAYPSLLLGALEASPLQVTQLYQTLAGGGYRVPLRAIREVRGREGERLQRYPLALEQAVPEGVAYLTTAALHEVTQRGTARSLSAGLPESLTVAGKTGTTDDLRDSWFAGYTARHVAVTWVGHDDNRPTGLSGATGAVPIWAELVGELQTEPLRPREPAGVEWAIVDPVSGLRADATCAGAQWMPFLAGSAPVAEAPCTRDVDSALHRGMRWFRGLFE
jgi:penicillin-binding protein 1B